jgi:hypothetical protein
MPLVARLGLTMNTAYGAGDEKKLVATVITQPGPTLISWQHGGIPDLAKAFPSVSPKPPSDNRFDVVWTFHQDRRRLAVRPGARARAARGQGHCHQELIVARSVLP